MKRTNSKAVLANNNDLLQIRKALMQEERRAKLPVPELAEKLGLDRDTYFKKASGKLFAKLTMLFNEGVKGIMEQGKVKRVEAYLPGQGFRMVKPIVEGDKMYFVIQQRNNRRQEVRIPATDSFPSLQLTENDFSAYVK